MDTPSLTFWGSIDPRSSAYGTINQAISSVLPSWVIMNRHDNGQGQLTDSLLVNVYPPTEPTIRHKINVAITTWEFMGQECYPIRYQHRLRKYDKIIVPTFWQKNDWDQWLGVPIEVIPYPISLKMSPKGPSYKFDIPSGKIKLLWVGGTDERHGIDLLHRFANLLTDDYHLIVKITSGYKKRQLKPHPRITVIDRFIPDMSVIYRAVDMLVELKRAVGFSLPVLEARVCGLPVVAVDLPPYHEFPFHIPMAPGGVSYYSTHEYYKDTLLRLQEPNLPELVELIKRQSVGRLLNTSGLDDYKRTKIVERLLNAVN